MAAVIFELLISINVWPLKFWENFLLVCIHSGKDLFLNQRSGENGSTTFDQDVLGLQAFVKAANVETVDGKVHINVHDS